MTDSLAPLIAFFERERQRRPVRGLAIVGCCAGIGLIGVLALLISMPAFDQPTVAFAAGGETVEAGAGSLLGALLTVLIPVVVWLVFGAIAFAVTYAGGGSGGFYRFVTLFGWGWVPALFVSVAWLAALLANIATTPTPETLEAGCEFCQQVQSGVLMDAVRVFEGAMVIVSAVVWIGAIEVGRNVSRPLALGTAALLFSINGVLWVLLTPW
jgi:hypothetical protein